MKPRQFRYVAVSEMVEEFSYREEKRAYISDPLMGSMGVVGRTLERSKKQPNQRGVRMTGRGNGILFSLEGRKGGLTFEGNRESEGRVQFLREVVRRGGKLNGTGGAEYGGKGEAKTVSGEVPTRTFGWQRKGLGQGRAGVATFRGNWATTRRQIGGAGKWDRLAKKSYKRKSLGRENFRVGQKVTLSS